MNRRSFFKASVAAGLGAALPVAYPDVWKIIDRIVDEHGTARVGLATLVPGKVMPYATSPPEGFWTDRAFRVPFKVPQAMPGEFKVSTCCEVALIAFCPSFIEAAKAIAVDHGLRFEHGNLEAVFKGKISSQIYLAWLAPSEMSEKEVDDLIDDIGSVIDRCRIKIPATP